MKKWLYLAAALTAAGILSRLPHPARDIAGLKPVRAVFVYMGENDLHIETDTGDCGSGQTLSEAAADMKARADGEIFLETAEFLLLSAQVRITEDFYALLRPSCRVLCTNAHPDLKEAAEFLSAHPPETTLAHLRAASARRGSERSPHESSKTANTLAPGRDLCTPGP